MVKIQVFDTDGIFRGGLFDTRAMGRLDQRLWRGRPRKECEETLLLRDEQFLLVRTSRYPEISGPEGDLFDRCSHAIRMNVKDAAEWLRDEGLKLPADIESVLDRDDSSTGSVREDVAMGHEPLDPTDIQILRILAGEDKRLVTDAIAERLRRSPKNIGKNLSKLRRLGFLVNTPRKGYELTGKGHEFSRRRSS